MNSFVRSVIWALLAAVVTAAVLIFIFALWAYNSDDPSSLIKGFGTAAFLVSCFAGGVTGARERGNILGSIAFAVIYILVCLTLGLALGGSIGTDGLLIYLGGIALALVGAIVFGGHRTRKPKNYRKFKKV